MMCKKKILIFLLCIIVFICILPQQTYSQQNSDVLIIYDRLTEYSDQRSQIVLLEQLISHFDVDVDIVNQNDYSKTLIEKYDFIFLVSLEEQFNNAFLKNDINISNKRFYFIGDIGEEYFPYDENELNIKSEIYNIFEYYNSNEQRKNIEFFSSSKVGKLEIPKFNAKYSGFSEIISVSDGKEKYPYLFYDEKNYFAASFDIDTNLFYYFVDTLFNIFDQNQKYETEVYVILNEIRPFCDINKVRKIINKFLENNIKVYINFMPTFVDLQTTYISTIDTNKKLVQAIHTFQEHGVGVILNGYSYVDNNNYITYKRSEFWDMESDMAYLENINDLYELKYKEALRLLFYHDINPKGVSVYNSAIALEGYKKIKEHFSNFYGKMQISITGYGPYEIPLTVHNSDYFNNYYPISVNIENEDFNEYMIDLRKYINNHKIIRDSTLGIGIAGDLQEEKVDLVIDLINNSDLDIFEETNQIKWIEIDEYKYRIDNENNVDLEGYSKRTDVVVKRRNIFMTVTNVLIIMVSFICLIFLFMFFRARRNSRKNLFIKERKDEN